MRAKLLGAVLAALVIPTALAGDIGKQGKISASAPATAEEPKWHKGGVYVGILAGYDVQVLQTEGVDIANGKLMAGGFVGYNWRLGQFMLGVEGDWIFTGIKGSSATEELSISSSTNHLISLRARAGIPLGPALIYLTAGPAWQSIRITANEASERTWQIGAAIGGGAEVELSRSLAVRLEAIHYIFPNDGAPLSQLLDSENQHTTVRVGVVFKLN